MYLDEETKQKILDAATMEAVLGKYFQDHKDRKRYHYECPLCKDGRLEYAPSKGIVKCFKCGYGAKTPVQLLMDTKKMEWKDVMAMLAQDFGITIPDKEYPTGTLPDSKATTPAKAKSFCTRQLEASGLSVRDVRAIWKEDGVDRQASPIFAGTVDAYGNITTTGDDMVIQYLNLDGKPMTYTDKRKGKGEQKGVEKPYFRVRWQFPESHLLRDGTMCKYKSPAGSSVMLYIPEALRRAYRKAEQLPDLYFTEGEKKAEAMSKYVGPAFGMSGINSMAGRDHQFPEYVVRVIEQCHVRRVYFIMDADWNDLSHHLDPEKDATMRPRAFFAAARNFRDWFQTLKNRNIDVEVYLVLGKGEQKGVDDQLMMMRPNTDRYKQLIAEGTNNVAAGGQTELFDIIKISTITDAKLQKLWGLGNVDEFLAKHFEQLKGQETFKAFRNLWRVNEEGKKELAQELLDDETFWTEIERTARDGSRYVDYKFDLVNLVHFLENRGYHRYVEENGEHSLVHLTGQRIERALPIEMRDQVVDLARQICNKEALNMIYRNHTNYLGPANMSLVSVFQPEFPTPERERQVLLFKTKYWEVSNEGIVEHDLSCSPFNYWQQDLIPFDAHTLKGRLVTVSHTDEGFQISLGDEAENCDFLRFLILTSWFDWDKKMDEDRRLKPEYDGLTLDPEEYKMHLLSKMTAIGYLLHQYHNPAVTKAVIALDERISAVGESQGRSGKSLISVALEQMINVVTIPAKGLDLVGDRFALEQVTPQTRVITLDDIDINFDFERLFPSITSSVIVNGKGTKRFSLEGHKKPKFYITTNHTLNNNTGSARDRQFKIAFSNYFDDTFKPEAEFGCQFFSEYWDAEQWNLFYNFMAECLQLYFEAQHNHWGVNGSGLIDAPCENLEKRQIRQQMTEGFYRWILDYYRIDEDNPYETAGTELRNRIERQKLFESYKESVNRRELQYITPQKFWQRLILFCRYFGYSLNPQIMHDSHGRPGHDKSSGVEYITISEKPFESTPV